MTSEPGRPRPRQTATHLKTAAPLSLLPPPTRHRENSNGSSEQRDSNQVPNNPAIAPATTNRSAPNAEPTDPTDANPSDEPQRGGSQPQPPNGEGRPGAGGTAQNGEQPSTGEESPANRQRSTLRGGNNNRPNGDGIEQLLERTAGSEGGAARRPWRPHHRPRFSRVVRAPAQRRRNARRSRASQRSRSHPRSRRRSAGRVQEARRRARLGQAASLDGRAA